MTKYSNKAPAVNWKSGKSGAKAPACSVLSFQCSEKREIAPHDWETEGRQEIQISHLQFFSVVLCAEFPAFYAYANCFALKGEMIYWGADKPDRGREMSRQPAEPTTAKTVELVIAFGLVYLIWSSTYLAIRFAVETLPPFLMAGIRFLIAGALLYAWMRFRGAKRPTLLHWRSTAIVGGLLLLGGNGGVVWAEQVVPSGITALMIATVPLWMVLIHWMSPGGERPSTQVWIGVVVGFFGIVLLVNPFASANTFRVDPIGAAVLCFATISWSSGSLYSRSASMPPESLLATAMEMLTGGAMLTLAGTVTGEWHRLNLAAASLRSLLSVAYLIVFGSLIAFSAYTWLLKNASPARVSTYAYVNPVIAVFLGWTLAGETLNSRIFVAATVIISAVILITSYKDKLSPSTK